MAPACGGGRTLEVDGLAGPEWVGPGGAATSSNQTGGSGGGGDGNNGNGNGNNGNGTTGFGGGGAVVTVTAGSTNGGTGGNRMGSGTCGDPYDLGESRSFSGVLEGPDNFSGSCPSRGPEIFLTWRAPRTGSYRIHTLGSAADTVLYRMSGPGCGADFVDCNDDLPASNTSELLFTAEQGEHMGFVLDSYYAGGAVQLRIDGTDVPPCGGAFAELSGVGQLFSQQLPLDDPTVTYPSTDTCGGAAPRVTFDWTAPNDGLFSFDTVGSNYDTVLVVRTVCEGVSGERCSDDDVFMQSGLQQAATEGQVLRVEIAAFGGNATPPMGGEPFVVLNVHED